MANFLFFGMYFNFFRDVKLQLNTKTEGFQFQFIRAENNTIRLPVAVLGSKMSVYSSLYSAGMLYFDEGY